MGIKRASDNLRSQRTRDDKLNAAEEQKESSKIVNFLSSQFSTLTANHNGKICRQANDIAKEQHETFAVMFPCPPFSLSPVLVGSDQTATPTFAVIFSFLWPSIFIQFLLVFVDCSSISWIQARRIRVLGASALGIGESSKQIIIHCSGSLHKLRSSQAASWPMVKLILFKRSFLDAVQWN